MELKRIVVPDIKKEMVAFANTHGGVIYVGVADDGSVEGLEDIDQASLQIASMLRDGIRPDLTMFVQIEQDLVEEKKILKVTVQKGTHSPYYLQGKGIRPEGVFLRQGTASIPASEDAIRMMIKQSDGERFESRRSLVQDLTFSTMERFFSDRHIRLEKQQFITLGLMSHDGIYTDLAQLLSEECPHTMKAAVFAGRKKTDAFQNRQEFQGSLLSQMEDVYDFLQRYNQKKADFDGLLRKDTLDYPEVALREALLNTVIHREYAYSGSTLINVFHDRIEFVSLGGLVNGLTLADLRLGISDCRNEKLAALFYRLKLIEAYGTGIPKIYESYESAGVMPKIEATEHAFRITLPNRNYEISPVQNTMTVTEDRILAAMYGKYSFTRADLENAMGISRSYANQYLQHLVKAGKIIPYGKGKNRRYQAAQIGLSCPSGSQ